MTDGPMADDPYEWPVLTGQVPVGSLLPGAWPDCPEHRERQHRDGKPPWCNACGWNRGTTIPPRQIGTPRGRPSGGPSDREG